jgi:ribokinase
MLPPFSKRPRIAALGVASWDELRVLDRYPGEGDWTYIRSSEWTLGGTTANLAAAAARLGSDVSFFAKISDDETGDRTLAALAGIGVDCFQCQRAPGQPDISIVLGSAETGERTILWQQGPYLQRGDAIAIDDLFGADLTVIDTPDLPLRRFLTDLPAHTRPNAKLLGTLTFFATSIDCDRIEIALRHDVLVGNEREYAALIGHPDPVEAFDAVCAAMSGSNLRMAIMTRGPRGCIGRTQNEKTEVPAFPVSVIDSTGAGDAFAGAVAFAQALHWPLKQTLDLASATASFVIAGLGAQRTQPTLDQVRERLKSNAGGMNG